MEPDINFEGIIIGKANNLHCCASQLEINSF